MPNQYTITVQNNTGTIQHYALFNEPPTVSSTVDSKVWTNAVKTANAGPGQSTTFVITSQYLAYVGSSSGKPGNDDVAVFVSGKQKVDLGDKALDGTLTKGTTLLMDIQGGAPVYTGTAPNGGKLGAFEIKTAAGNGNNNFSFQNALDNGWVIGLAKVVNGTTVPAATITPQPNCSYQVQPINVWYVAYGDYTAGQVCNFEMTGLTKATINFTSGTANAQVVHSDGGQITTQQG